MTMPKNRTVVLSEEQQFELDLWKITILAAGTGTLLEMSALRAAIVKRAQKSTNTAPFTAKIVLERLLAGEPVPDWIIGDEQYESA